jgi:hypothetical protein
MLYRQRPLAAPKLLVRVRRAAPARAAFSPNRFHYTNIRGWVVNVRGLCRFCTTQRVRQYLTDFGFDFGCFERRRRKRLASRKRSRSVSLTIRQTLASRTLDGKVRTFPIVDAPWRLRGQHRQQTAARRGAAGMVDGRWRGLGRTSPKTQRDHFSCMLF